MPFWKKQVLKIENYPKLWMSIKQSLYFGSNQKCAYLISFVLTFQMKLLLTHPLLFLRPKLVFSLLQTKQKESGLISHALTSASCISVLQLQGVPIQFLMRQWLNPPLRALTFRSQALSSNSLSCLGLNHKIIESQLPFLSWYQQFHQRSDSQTWIGLDALFKGLAKQLNLKRLSLYRPFQTTQTYLLSVKVQRLLWSDSSFMNWNPNSLTSCVFRSTIVIWLRFGSRAITSSAATIPIESTWRENLCQKRTLP